MGSPSLESLQVYDWVHEPKRKTERDPDEEYEIEREDGTR